jgi:hypothetical protein
LLNSAGFFVLFTINKERKHGAVLVIHVDSTDGIWIEGWVLSFIKVLGLVISWFAVVKLCW